MLPSETLLRIMQHPKIESFSDIATSDCVMSAIFQFPKHTDTNSSSARQCFSNMGNHVAEIQTYYNGFHIRLLDILINIICVLCYHPISNTHITHSSCTSILELFRMFLLGFYNCFAAHGIVSQTRSLCCCCYTIDDAFERKPIHSIRFGWLETTPFPQCSIEI